MERENAHSKIPWLLKTLLGVAGLSLAHLLYLCFVLKVNYFDTYSIYANAHILAEGNSSDLFYYWMRTPLLSLLLAPLFMLEKTVLSVEQVFIVSRLVAVVFYAVFAWITYALLRDHLEKEIALASAALLALSPLLIHYAPFFKEDILGALLTAAAFYFYLKPRSPANTACLCAALSLSSLTRLHLLPLIWAVIFLYELVRFRHGSLKNDVGQKLTFMVGIPLAVFVIVQTALVVTVESVSLPGALKLLAGRFAEMVAVHQLIKEPARENAVFLLYSLTWPVAAVMLVGVFYAWREKLSGVVFFSLWLGVFLLFHCWTTPHKEARYLLPLFVPLYYFFGSGLAELDKIWKRWAHRLSSPLWGLLLAALIGFAPVTAALGEHLHFHDPAYRNDLSKKISASATALAQDNAIHWIGPMYPQHPERFIVAPEDEFFDIYHLHANAIQAYTGREVLTFMAERIDFFGSAAAGFFVRSIGPHVKDGDVLIINLEPATYTSATLPPALHPLVIEKIRKVFFYPDRDHEDGMRTFRSNEHPKARLDVHQSNSSINVMVSDAPAEAMDLYVKTAHLQKSRGFKPAKLKNGRLFVKMENIDVSLIEYFYGIYYRDVQLIGQR